MAKKGSYDLFVDGYFGGHFFNKRDAIATGKMKTKGIPGSKFELL